MKTMILLAGFVFAILFGGYLIYLSSKHKKYFEREKEYEEAFSSLRRDFPNDAFLMKWGKIVFLVVEAVLATIALLPKN